MSQKGDQSYSWQLARLRVFCINKATPILLSIKNVKLELIKPKTKKNKKQNQIKNCRHDHVYYNFT